jgi:ribosome biogenesis GTPase
MQKKKEKKKFTRRQAKLKNVNIDQLDSILEDDDLLITEKTETKPAEKLEKSKKDNMILKEGIVLEITTNYKCRVQVKDEILECTISGRLKQMNVESRTLIAVGDNVNVDISEQPRVEEINPRKNALSRFSEKEFQTEMIIAANIDQVAVTTSYREPEINWSLVDRYLCSARIEDIEPIIVVNKIDLLQDQDEYFYQTCEFYNECGFTLVTTSTVTDEGLKVLKQNLENKTTVFSGHSGVGKSSLINKLQTGISLKVAKVSDYTQKGIHTTSRSRLIPWDFGGFLVDTPGIRTFGLSRKHKDKISRVFPGFDKLLHKCRYPNCTHTHELICGVKYAVDKNHYPKNRYNSYIRLLESL